MRLVALVAGLLSWAVPVLASDPAPPAPAASPAAAAAPASPAQASFARLKAMEGTWTGTAADDSGKPFEASVVYKVTSAGHVVQETLFAGTPHEMVDMYHLDGDRLVLTHYCAAGNQPHLALEPGKDPAQMAFSFVSGTNMKETDMHMHAVRFTFADADHVRQVWTSLKDGKPAGTATFELARKK